LIKVSNFLIGVVAATFVCPLDVIKTRFQVHGLPKLGDANIKGLSFFFPFKSSQKLDSVADVIVSGFWSGSLIVGSLEQIFKREGMRGLYRGLSPTVMALLSNWAVSFHFFFLELSIFFNSALYLFYLFNKSYWTFADLFYNVWPAQELSLFKWFVLFNWKPC